jgi:uncharacterized protein (DUF697 family)
MSVPGTRRAAVLVVAAGLFPVPFVDTMLQNAVRRALVSRVGHHHGLDLAPAEVRALADAPLAPGRRLVSYAAKRVLGRLLLPVAAWSAVSTVRETLALPQRVLAAKAIPLPDPE